MVRDSEDKIRYDLIYMPMLTRWANHMTKGAAKYSAHNWERAETVEELDRFLQSAFRHFVQWFTNEDNLEDHASAVFFNISGAELVKEKLGPDWQQKLINYQLGKEDK
jgi:EAL domain-containing protein (putative c-di-GMP-specific phosphodiesterase class I)